MLAAYSPIKQPLTRDNLSFGFQLVCDRLDIRCGRLLMIIHELFVKMIPPESSLINHSVLDSLFQQDMSI